MPDPTSICNEALVELGGTLIQSFTDGTSPSTVCGIHYPDARDMALEMHPWNFATAFARLARSPDTPVMKWQYMYALPTHPWCIKVRATDRANAKWEVGDDEHMGRVLYSNDGAVSIEFTKRIEDLGSWSPLSLQVLVKVMAAKLAKYITGQNSTEDIKLKEAYTLLPEARASDSREGSPQTLQANSSLLLRHRGWAGFPWGPRWRDGD